MKDRTTKSVEVPRSVVDEAIAALRQLGPEHDRVIAQLEYAAGYVAEGALLRAPTQPA